MPAAALALALAPSTGRPQSRAVAPQILSIGRPDGGRRIPAGFLGLSLEIPSVEAYAGRNPHLIDPVFEQLIRNLTPAQRPVLRLGGDSTDWTWWPSTHVPGPRGLRYALTGRWLKVTHALAVALDARLILGVNLEADSPRLSSTEARAMLRGVGRHWIQALELGNEPELYPNLSGRTSRDGFRTFLPDYSRIARSLPHTALAGPSTGSLTWMSHLGRFIVEEPRLRLVTLHRYPPKHCGANTEITIAQLLSERSATGLARSVAPSVTIAHAHRLRVRVDEMNSVSCGGERGVSDSFAAALWSLDALFSMARVGVDGVNIHTRPASSNRLFTIAHDHRVWRADIHPEYYGLMLFAQAAPPGSRLLRTSGLESPSVRAWATAGPGRQLNVVLINRSATLPSSVEVREGSAVGAGTLERLQAPGLSAMDGVTLGGQRIGAGTATGLLAGTPQVERVRAHTGTYTVSLPPASAVLLKLSMR